jgi:hypothetical protein
MKLTVDDEKTESFIFFQTSCFNMLNKMSHQKIHIGVFEQKEYFYSQNRRMKKSIIFPQRKRHAQQKQHDIQDKKCVVVHLKY